jgi:hypothetical protein
MTTYIYHQDGGGGPVGVWGARLLVLSHVLCWVRHLNKERKKERKYCALRVDVRAPLRLVFCPSALLLIMRRYADKEEWPDMANGHVLSRAPKWVQSQLHLLIFI